jgi:type IV secretory pathway VirB10-like protein
MDRTTRARLLAASALMAFASLVQAQYMWIDEKGIKQFSDRAPPASVPLKNILKAPKGVPSAANMPAEPPAVAAVPAAKPKDAPSLADRNADYTKRAKETAEREQKEKEEQQAKADKAENCERARAARQTIDSGVRIGQTDKNGERGFMSDEQRAAESKKVDKALASCK